MVLRKQGPLLMAVSVATVLVLCARVRLPMHEASKSLFRRLQLTTKEVEALWAKLNANENDILDKKELVDLYDGHTDRQLVVKDCNNVLVGSHYIGDGICDEAEPRTGRSPLSANGRLMDLNCKIFNCDGGDCMQGSGARRNLKCRDTGTRLFPSVEGCKPNDDGTCNGKPVFGAMKAGEVSKFEFVASGYGVSETPIFQILASHDPDKAWHLQSARLQIFDVDGTTLIADEADAFTGATWGPPHEGTFFIAIVGTTETDQGDFRLVVNTVGHSDCQEGYEVLNGSCRDVDECTSAPCANDGVCDHGLDVYECECTTGWEGENCEEDGDECAEAPCQNGGVCAHSAVDPTIASGAFACKCPDTFSGVRCQTEEQECKNRMDDTAGVAGFCDQLLAQGFTCQDSFCEECDNSGDCDSACGLCGR